MSGSVTTTLVPGAADATVIKLVGEFDTVNVGRVGEAADAALGEQGSRLVVDLSEVSFLDSTLLNVLIGLHQRTQRADGGLVLVCPPARVWRVFEVTGLSRLLRAVASVEAALAALEPSPRAARH